MHAQLYPTLVTPMECSPAGSSVHGISWARILEWVTISVISKEDLASGPEIMLEYSGILCGKSFITGKRERESF